MLVLQAVAGLTMVAASGSGTAGATLVIVAAEVASILPPRVAWPWVAVQSVLVGVIWAQYDTVINAISVTGAFGGFQAFALATIALEHRERAARQDLAGANAELLATRSLLAENSRVSERVRIARDLHDTLGHHLTALSLQLDVAARLSSGQAATHVQEAHAIAKLLLSDVRHVVSEMRDTSRMNLGDAVRALTGAGSGALQIHVDMPESIDVADAAQAQAMLRCVQEIITNAARHAAAHNLWIVIESRPDGIALHARDDGRGSDGVTWGNGLRGMRERFAEHAGRVEFSSQPGNGFEVHGFMPRAEAAR
jgi:signal transduction histidine kinase